MSERNSQKQRIQSRDKKIATLQSAIHKMDEEKLKELEKAVAAFASTQAIKNREAESNISNIATGVSASAATALAASLISSGALIPIISAVVAFLGTTVLTQSKNGSE